MESSLGTDRGFCFHFVMDPKLTDGLEIVAQDQNGSFLNRGRFGIPLIAQITHHPGSFLTELSSKTLNAYKRLPH